MAKFQVQEALQQEALKVEINSASWWLKEAIAHLKREVEPPTVIQDLCTGAEEFANNMQAIRTCRELLDAIEAQYQEAGDIFQTYLEQEMKAMKKAR